MLLLLWPAEAAAQRVEHLVDWSPRVFAVRGPGDIEVRIPTGRVHVVPGPEGRIQLSGSLKTTARDPESAKQASHASNINADGDGDKVLVEVTEQDPSHGGTTAELTVEVPPRAIVKVRGRAVSVDAQHLAVGYFEVQTKTGSVQVGLAQPASVRAETANGRIEQDVGLSLMKRGRHAVVEGSYDGGGPAVRLQTGQGNITLHPAR